ncbi:MAG: sugar transferase [Proteobacteria bacterium]|nr:MAG: sugar transferase [Pseudomonadota bacterium]
MIRIFKHYVRKSLFLLGVIEVLILLAAIIAGLTLRFTQLDLTPIDYADHWPEFVTFVTSVYVAMLAVGLYQPEVLRDTRMTLVRLTVAMGLGLVLTSVVSYVVRDVGIWRSIFLYALGFAFVGLLISRGVFFRLADREGFKRRVVLLGAGERAKRIAEMEKSVQGANFVCAGVIRLSEAETAIPHAPYIAEISSLLEYVRQAGAEEIVVANEERRGTLPIHDLLVCKMQGVRVSDATTFIEQETGVVDLESVSPSWMIFSDGFVRSGRLDLALKRTFDIIVSVLLLALSLPILAPVALAIKFTSPGPIFYRQERVGQGGRTFQVMKFRSMRADAERAGPQWAQKNDDRVTSIGRIIRLTRIDEIPQIFNVLKGDMSFVGPRPERPVFVAELTRQIPYYEERHQVKPGITGWAQINYPYGASTEDARRKLQYDLYYIKNYSIFLDLLVLIQTLRVILWPEGAR